ncbi:MAG TPA: class I SAM-dependent methyltransferase, partial [Bacilli bacterium]|nr:class I SAM-dependent methyltransferase [Bacilli bacterium]
KGSKQICTTAKTTLIALKKAIRLLDVGGICVLVFYPGHREGKIEAQEVGEYLKTLDQKEFDIIKYEFINQINMPPFLIALERLKP